MDLTPFSLISCRHQRRSIHDGDCDDEKILRLRLSSVNHPRLRSCHCHVEGGWVGDVTSSQLDSISLLSIKLTNRPSSSGSEIYFQ